MKVIYPEKINSITASSEDANWPVSNVLDNYRTHVWKSTETGSATLTLNMAGGSNVVSVFNIPGVDTIRVVVKDNNGNVIDDNTYDVYIINTYTAFFTNQAVEYCNLWAEYSYQSNTHTIELTFTMLNPADVVQVGVVRAGLAKTFKNPETGIKEGFKDYSIIKELNNGAFYTRKRNIVRTFSGTFVSVRDRDFYIFSDFYKQISNSPFACQIVQDGSQNWNIFGHFIQPISGSHFGANWSRISFEIQEAI